MPTKKPSIDQEQPQPAFEITVGANARVYVGDCREVIPTLKQCGSPTRHGEVDLVLTARWHREELFRLPGLPMDFGGDVLDLGDIELRGKIHAFRIKVTDSNGNRIHRFSIRGEASTFPREVPGWTCIICSLQPRIDFDIIAPGFRIERVRGLGENRDIVLRRGIAVRIHLDNLMLLPEGTEVYGSLFPLDPETVDGVDWGLGVSMNGIDTKGNAIALPQSGRYFLQWYLREARSHSILQQGPWTPEDDSIFFDVLDQDFEQDLHFSFDAATIADMERAARDWPN